MNVADTRTAIKLETNISPNSSVSLRGSTTFTYHRNRTRAVLTIRHGTHVRRAPSWKGAPEEWHAANILSMPFSLRCRRRKFCLNVVTQKSTKVASNRASEWLDNGHSFVDRCSRVSESCLTCLFSVATCDIQCTIRDPGPNILLRGPIRQSRIIMLQCMPESFKNFTWSTILRWSTVATVLLNCSCELLNF